MVRSEAGAGGQQLGGRKGEEMKLWQHSTCHHRTPL